MHGVPTFLASAEPPPLAATIPEYEDAPSLHCGGRAHDRYGSVVSGKWQANAISRARAARSGEPTKAASASSPAETTSASEAANPAGPAVATHSSRSAKRACSGSYPAEATESPTPITDARRSVELLPLAVSDSFVEPLRVIVDQFP